MLTNTLLFLRKKLGLLASGIGLLGGLAFPASAVTQHYRLVLTEEPTATALIGWELLGGCPDTQRVYYDTIDHGQDTSAYAYQASPEVDLVLIPPSSEATQVPKVVTFPRSLSFVVLIWQETQLHLLSPEQEKLMDVFAN